MGRRVTNKEPSGDDAARELDCLMVIGTMAGRVAHEINNPLASIQNAFMLIKDAIPPSHPHFAYVAAIEREIRRIASVTRRLTESYRPEQDRAVGIAVAAIVADAVSMASWDGATTHPRFQVDNRVQAVFGGPAGLLRHALHQVFDAAADVAATDQPILVEVIVDGVQLRVSVAYRVGNSSPSSRPVQFPRRLIAAMGGAFDVQQSESDRKELTVHIPMTVRQAPSA